MGTQLFSRSDALPFLIALSVSEAGSKLQRVRARWRPAQQHRSQSARASSALAASTTMSVHLPGPRATRPSRPVPAGITPSGRLGSVTTRLGSLEAPKTTRPGRPAVPGTIRSGRRAPLATTLEAPGPAAALHRRKLLAHMWPAG